jgi:hypothetical protein
LVSRAGTRLQVRRNVSRASPWATSTRKKATLSTIRTVLTAGKRRERTESRMGIMGSARFLQEWDFDVYTAGKID